MTDADTASKHRDRPPLTFGRKLLMVIVVAFAGWLLLFTLILPEYRDLLVVVWSLWMIATIPVWVRLQELWSDR